jgi:hypothetical protein
MIGYSRWPAQPNCRYTLTGPGAKKSWFGYGWRASEASVLVFGGYDPTSGTSAGPVSRMNIGGIASGSGAAITAGSLGGNGGAGASGFISHQFGSKLDHLTR